MRGLFLGLLAAVSLVLGLPAAGATPLGLEPLSAPVARSVPAASHNCGKGQHWVPAGYAKHGQISGWTLCPELIGANAERASGLARAAAGKPQAALLVGSASRAAGRELSTAFRTRRYARKATDFLACYTLVSGYIYPWTER